MADDARPAGGALSRIEARFGLMCNPKVICNPEVTGNTGMEMSALDDKPLRGGAKARARNYWGAILAMVAGGLMVGVGFSLRYSGGGGDATGWGLLAGLGGGIAVIGAVLAWRSRAGPATASDMPERDRLQARRARHLWFLPIVNIAFLIQSTAAIDNILGGAAGFGDFLTAPLPVLYAWAVALIIMGWDTQSRSRRRYMEDELTRALRAQSIGLAFLVLMAGVTVAFGLALWRLELAVYAMVYALAAAGAAAGLRFAWLDREFSKDG